MQRVQIACIVLLDNSQYVVPNDSFDLKLSRLWHWFDRHTIIKKEAWLTIVWIKTLIKYNDRTNISNIEQYSETMKTTYVINVVLCFSR